jgi:hypothetical protein
LDERETADIVASTCGEFHTGQQARTRKTILNIAASGKFSSDRTGMIPCRALI